MIKPETVSRYLAQKFGDDLAGVRNAMEGLAGSYEPTELAEAAYGLYEKFRPRIPAGAAGWGAKGTLDLGLLEVMARRKR